MVISLGAPPLLTHVNPSELSQSLPQVTVVSFIGPGQQGSVSKVLEPLVAKLSSKVNWVAPNGPATNGGGGQRVDGFWLHSPQPAQNLLDAHEKFSLEYLRPLLHGMPELANFDPSGWRAYRQLNEICASHALSVSSGSFPTIVWIHDYQFALVAPRLSIESGIIPCQFWHVSWPKPDVLAGTPVGLTLVQALLANRLIGFHTTEYAMNFLNCVQELVPNAQVDLMRMEVQNGNSVTKVVVMPLGLDFAYWQHLANAARPKAAAIPKKYRLASQVILGIDRLDNSKGVLEKLSGVEAFLQENPSFHRRFHFVQIVQSQNPQTNAQHQYAEMVQAKVTQINNCFGTGDWEPVLYLDETLKHEELAAWYLAADGLVVTPVRDGLNLIAKEYVACRSDEQGVLILSKQAGAAAELVSGAVLVDAHDAKQIGEAIAEAMTMRVEEKRRRMLSMRHIVGWNQLHDWAMSFLKQAAACK